MNVKIKVIYNNYFSTHQAAQLSNARTRGRNEVEQN